MKIDFQGFLAALPILGKGMAGIFIVTAVIVLCVFLLNYLTARLGKKQ